MAQTLGEKLKSAREERGASINEVAEHTRISAHYLEAIERNEFKILPGGIFNKGFIKSFAKFVGVNEQEALKDYGALMATQEVEDEKKELSYRPEVLTDDRAGGSMFPTIIFAVVILGLLTGGILMAVNYIQNSQQGSSSANTSSNSATATPSATPPTSETAASNTTSVQPTPVSTDSIKIEMKSISQEATKPAITAFIDGKFDSYTFQADEPKVYEPETSAKISFSKWQVANLQLSINGKPITLPTTPFNAKRQSIEFEINETNIAKVLAAGAITAESTGYGLPANANTAANAAPAGTAAPTNTAPPTNVAR